MSLLVLIISLLHLYLHLSFISLTVLEPRCLGPVPQLVLSALRAVASRRGSQGAGRPAGALPREVRRHPWARGPRRAARSAESRRAGERSGRLFCFVWGGPDGGNELFFFSFFFSFFFGGGLGGPDGGYQFQLVWWIAVNMDPLKCVKS